MIWSCHSFYLYYVKSVYFSPCLVMPHKGIFTDSRNIFLWHKSEDIIKKRLFPNFQMILIFAIQVMQDNVHWQCFTYYCVKLILGHENLCYKCSSFTRKQFLLNMYFFEESYKQVQKKIQILTFLRTPSTWNLWLCL